MLPIRFIFMSAFPKVCEFERTGAAPAGQNYYFQQITEILKINMFLKICKYLLFTSKNNRQKENTKEKKMLGPQNGQICFWLGQRKSNFFNFSSFLAFKQTKEKILIQVQPLKIIKNFLAHFRVTVKIFRGPQPTFQKEKFRIWGPFAVWHNLLSAQFFLSKITPPYCVGMAGVGSCHIGITGVGSCHFEMERVGS